MTYYVYDPVSESYLKSFYISFGKLVCEWTKNINMAKGYKLMRYVRQICERIGDGCIVVDEDGNEIEV